MSGSRKTEGGTVGGDLSVARSKRSMPPIEFLSPASQFYISQRLRLHYLDWGGRAEDGSAKPLMLLVHGGRDHAHNWDWFASAFRDRYHIVAPDLRGHGDSAWAIGGMYAISDFVLDLVQLLEAVDKFPVTIVAHSLGGMISLQYAGLFPDKVERIVAIEGLGPSPKLLAERANLGVTERMQTWIADMQKLAGRSPKRYPSMEAAMERMREVNTFLSEEQARHLTVHGVARNEDGTYSWKFDNYVRANAPFRFDGDEIRTIWSQISCPTLLARGTESWASDPVVDGRIEAFTNARRVNFAGAGHWVHHDRLEEFVSVVNEFLVEG